MRRSYLVQVVTVFLHWEWQLVYLSLLEQEQSKDGKVLICWQRQRYRCI